MYATNYIRNSKAIGVLWGIFTICYAIIGVVAFITPEWLGDLEHENPGRFGLWMRCSFGGTGNSLSLSLSLSLSPPIPLPLPYSSFLLSLPFLRPAMNLRRTLLSPHPPIAPALSPRTMSLRFWHCFGPSFFARGFDSRVSRSLDFRACLFLFNFFLRSRSYPFAFILRPLFF
jgi:hypothetical protein